ncbi:MAG: DJ-1/PfpI family protein [Lachnospiraceae bacterium]|nr:DJ-1/PfpI family protein [Lachnospiraceae bacterium]
MFDAKTDFKTAVFFADGFEEIEALTVTDILFRAGMPTLTVSVNDKPVVTSSHDITIVTDTTIDDVKFNDIDMLVLPGGMPGTTKLGACSLLTGAITDFVSQGKPVAAICAAPSVFADLGILRGKAATCHPSVEARLIEGGADLLHDPVVTDGNIITSRGMGTAIEFALALVKRCLGQAEADRIAAAIVYRADE